jgi:hypothetical protein
MDRRVYTCLDIRLSTALKVKTGGYYRGARWNEDQCGRREETRSQAHADRGGRDGGQGVRGPPGVLAGSLRRRLALALKGRIPCGVQTVGLIGIRLLSPMHKPDYFSQDLCFLFVVIAGRRVSQQITGQTYTYEVRAVNSASTSEFSNGLTGSPKGTVSVYANSGSGGGSTSPGGSTGGGTTSTGTGAIHYLNIENPINIIALLYGPSPVTNWSSAYRVGVGNAWEWMIDSIPAGVTTGC